MIKLKASVKFKDDFSSKLRKGNIVHIDRMKAVENRIMVRVSHIWKRPEWFNIKWFSDIRILEIDITKA